MTTPNLLVIMSDEHQARALSCAGHFAQTPNLDALAAHGTRFTNAYTPCAICVPARASFATGLPVHQTRLWDNAMPYHGQIPGWGHALQDAGVPVESIGKLHYRDAKDPAGFDVEHIPMMVKDGVGMVWGSLRRADERVEMPVRMLGDYIGPGDSAYTDYDAAVTDRTIEWLGAREHEEPWCLYVGLVAPHFPLVVPQEFMDLYPAKSLPPTKLRPADGYRRHPWVEAQFGVDRSEDLFTDEAERVAAIRAYYGLVSWMDHNVGRILSALEAAGLTDATNVIYTSDHGDNVGARGMWGKSTLYQESAAIPMIMAGPDVGVGVCETPMDLLDLSATIAEHFGTSLPASPGRSLYRIASEPDDPERPVLSQYHAVGAVSGAYMLRWGRWKYHHYVGFAPELFDLDADPEETNDLAADPAYAERLAACEVKLREMVDPEAADAQAFADQDAMIAVYGGRDAALKLGAPAATPPPELGQ
ncbi:MAG: sulfatase-like hydrolase/transferase [Pseudomonadota bacterium]